MKAKLKFGLLSLFLVVISLSSSYAQDCQKKELCNADFLGSGFDYIREGQTRSAILAPGDTVRTNVVVYSDKTTRVFVCSETTIGEVQFKIFKKVTEIQKYVKQVKKNEREEEVYVKDANGNNKLDEWGDPLVEYKNIVEYDTLWGSKKIIKEVQIFDNKTSSAGYLQKKFDRSQRLIIEAIIPEKDEDVEGCVRVYAGCKTRKPQGFTLDK